MKKKLKTTTQPPFRTSMKFAIKSLAAIAIIANIAAAIMGAVA